MKCPYAMEKRLSFYVVCCIDNEECKIINKTNCIKLLKFLEKVDVKK